MHVIFVPISLFSQSFIFLWKEFPFFVGTVLISSSAWIQRTASSTAEWNGSRLKVDYFTGSLNSCFTTLLCWRFFFMSTLGNQWIRFWIKWSNPIFWPYIQLRYRPYFQKVIFIFQPLSKTYLVQQKHQKTTTTGLKLLNSEQNKTKRKFS